MHTVVPIIEEGTGILVEYQVCFTSEKYGPGAPIAKFAPGDCDSAAHLCNRLNGGMSSEMAAIVKNLGPILQLGLVEMQKDKGG